MSDLRAALCTLFICAASACLSTHAQDSASPEALPPPMGSLPLQELKGGPVEPPSTDPRNFAGVWTPAQGLFGTYPPQNPTLPLTPETQKRVQRYLDMSAGGRHVATPHLACRPTGVQGMTFLKFPVVVVQTPEKIFFLMQEDRDVYQVFLNRGHPVDLKPSYNGDAVGRWEGNTLVVDVVGYNGWGFINEEAWSPSSERMHLVQRYTKSADGRELSIETTLTDPKFYSKPFALNQRWRWVSGTRQVEYDCSEYPPDTSVPLMYENEIFRPVCTTVLSETAGEKIVCEKTSSPAAKGK